MKWHKKSHETVLCRYRGFCNSIKNAYYSAATNSTSKINVELAGIAPGTALLP